jgi:hypothetical protein
MQIPNNAFFAQPSQALNSRLGPDRNSQSDGCVAREIHIKSKFKEPTMIMEAPWLARTRGLASILATLITCGSLAAGETRTPNIATLLADHLNYDDLSKRQSVANRHPDVIDELLKDIEKRRQDLKAGEPHR